MSYVNKKFAFVFAAALLAAVALPFALHAEITFTPRACRRSRADNSFRQRAGFRNLCAGLSRSRFPSPQFLRLS